MTIDITDLCKSLDMPVAVSGILEIPQEYNLSDTKLAVNIQGSLTNTEIYYIFDGFIDAELPLCCDKCLVLVNIPLRVELCEKFSSTGYIEQQEEIWDFTGNLIDLEPAVMSCLLLNIPLKTLCHIDCKGLCSICGNNLNIKECNCAMSDIDPRFKKLVSFFKDKEV